MLACPPRGHINRIQTRLFGLNLNSELWYPSKKWYSSLESFFSNMWKVLFPTESWSPNRHCTVLWFPCWVLSFCFFSLKFPFIRTALWHPSRRPMQQGQEAMMWQSQSTVVAASAAFSKFIQRTMFSTGKHSIAGADGPGSQRASQKGSTYMLCSPHKQGTSSTGVFRRKHKSDMAAGLRRMSSLFKLMNFTFLTWQKVQCWMTHSYRTITQEPSERQGCLLILDLMARQDICCWTIKAMRTRKP